MAETMFGSSFHLARGAQTLVAQQFAVRPGEGVLITCDGDTERALIDALVTAVAACGGQPLVTVLPKLPFQGALADPFLPDALAAAAAAADVWLDFSFPYIAGSKLHAAALKAGRVRYALLNLSAAESLARLYGDVDFEALMDFQVALVEYLDARAGATATTRCPLGSAFSFQLDEIKLKRARVASNPGMHTMPGAQNLYPVDGTVKGRIVLQGLFDEHYRLLRQPIVLEVEGDIRSIAGGGSEDLPRFDRALRRASGRNEMGRIIHLTMGFHPAARLSGRYFTEDIRIPGSNAIGMGLPWWVEGGGENHPDGILLDQSFWIDGEQVLDRGRLVGPGHLLPLYEKVAPLFY